MFVLESCSKTNQGNSRKHPRKGNVTKNQNSEVFTPTPPRCMRGRNRARSGESRSPDAHWQNRLDPQSGERDESVLYEGLEPRPNREQMFSAALGRGRAGRKRPRRRAALKDRP